MWTSKYENGCLIMLKYALEPLYAPEPLCDCLHQVVTQIFFKILQTGQIHALNVVFLISKHEFDRPS